MKKRLFFLCIIAGIFIFVLSASACAETGGTCGENLTWTLDNEGTLTISGTGAMDNYNNNSWKDYNQKIRSLIIDDGVTSIGHQAFYDCSNLTAITIPSSVTDIGDGAFFGCSSLTSVVIPSSVKKISGGTFYWCTSLTDVTIPSSVTSIGVEAFHGCSSLTSVEIPYGVTTVESGAFMGCSSMATAAIPASVTSIGSTAFIGCNSLTDVYYGGTETQWNNLKASIGANNEPLLNAMVHFMESDTLDDFTVTIPSGMSDKVTITEPKDGWVIGESTFSVSADKACVLAVSYDSGQTYTRLLATANGDGTYSFNVNIADENTVIACAYKGDANGDNDITSGDINKIKAASLGKTNLSSLAALTADVNGDNDLTSGDITKLKAAMLGKTTIGW